MPYRSLVLLLAHVQNEAFRINRVDSREAYTMVTHRVVDEDCY